MTTWKRSLQEQGPERPRRGRHVRAACLPLIVTAAVVLSAVAPAAPAAAAPPANDDIADAVVVSGAGFSATADTREATFAQRTPGAAWPRSGTCSHRPPTAGS